MKNVKILAASAATVAAAYALVVHGFNVDPAIVLDFAVWRRK